MEEISEMGGEDSPLANNDRKIVGGIFVLLVLFLGAFSDYDEDGLSNISEFTIHDTDMLELDTDWDGLTDKEELDIGTNPMKKDTDEDGLKDGIEVNYVSSDPLNEDSDNDTLSDGQEVNLHKTNPLLADSDGDGLTDPTEINTYGTNPMSNDSDNDSLTDGEEVNNHGTEPLNSDTDSDGLLDGEEINIFATNPSNSDTDADGILDGADVLKLNDAEIRIYFGFEATEGDSLSAPDPYFEFEIYSTSDMISDDFHSTGVYADTYTKYRDEGGSFILEWDDSQEQLQLSIFGWDSDVWNADELLDLGPEGYSGIHYTIQFSDLVNGPITIDFVPIDEVEDWESEGYPCAFSLRIMLVQ